MEINDNLPSISDIQFNGKIYAPTFKICDMTYTSKDLQQIRLYGYNYLVLWIWSTVPTYFKLVIC